MDQPEYDYTEIPTAVSLAAPAVRMVVVHATYDYWAEPPVTFHKIEPVIALQSKLVTHLCRKHQTQHSALPYTLAEADQEGWWTEGVDAVISAIVFTTHAYEEPELIDVNLAYTASNVAWQMEVCPWDPSEDEARLAELIAKLRSDAIAKVESRDARESRPAPLTSP
jgi:hypothetical protein